MDNGVLGWLGVSEHSFSSNALWIALVPYVEMQPPRNHFIAVLSIHEFVSVNPKYMTSDRAAFLTP